MDGNQPAAHDAPAVLLLHGQPGSPTDWQFVKPLLNGRVLTPDRPGYGDSPLPAGDFAFNAQAMDSYLGDQGVEKAIVVGYSWSGAVALQMALSFPERVAGIVLVSSIGPGAVDRLDRLMVVPGVSRIAARIAIGLGRSAFHPRFRGPLNLLLEGRLRSAAKAILHRDHQHRLADTFALEQKVMVAELDGLVSRLNLVTVPTKIVHATDDWFISIRTARSLNAQIRGSELRELKKGSHYLPHHHADDVAAAINDLASDLLG